jgi:peptide/nickel transport system ATP-binding protein
VPDDALLSVSHLSVRFEDHKRSYAILPDLSFDVGSECVGLVGESGSGKSLTARAILGLLERPLVARAAHLRLGEVDLQRCSKSEWNRLRGSRLSLMLQDPRHSLNPVLRVGHQLDLALRVHQRLPAAGRRERIAYLLDAVGLTQLQRVLTAYPHQLSGGMGQRVVLAMMLLNDPEILIADEPTSALDVALREQVMELILGLVRTRRMGLLLISHDLQMVSRIADRALVMYRGRIVDQGPAAELARSSHPYTRALWASRPSGRTYGAELPVFDPASVADEAPE